MEGGSLLMAEVVVVGVDVVDVVEEAVAVTVAVPVPVGVEGEVDPEVGHLNLHLVSHHSHVI